MTTNLTTPAQQTTILLSSSKDANDRRFPAPVWERRLYETNAPVPYDGFGTIQVSDPDEPRRLVLIDPEHLEWQTRRYASGGYGAAPVADPQAERFILNDLLAGITQLTGRD